MLPSTVEPATKLDEVIFEKINTFAVQFDSKCDAQKPVMLYIIIIRRRDRAGSGSALVRADVHNSFTNSLRVLTSDKTLANAQLPTS